MQTEEAGTKALVFFLYREQSVSEIFRENIFLRGSGLTFVLVILRSKDLENVSRSSGILD